MVILQPYLKYEQGGHVRIDEYSKHSHEQGLRKAVYSSHQSIAMHQKRNGGLHFEHLLKHSVQHTS